MSGFRLDDRLAADTVAVCDLALCRVLLMNDRRYPWVILVPRIDGASEIPDLGPEQRNQLLRESVDVSAAMRTLFPGDRLNVAALGNIVPQLHLHHVIRRKDDPAWPNPVWGHSPAVPYPPQQAADLVARLRRTLQD